MARRFGDDFGDVRVHTDARSAGEARELNAAAYTRGSDIVFGAGRYRPGTPGGDRLLTHELTHVLQQRTAAGRREVTSPGDRSEQQAEAVAGSRYRESGPVAGYVALEGGALPRYGGLAAVPAEAGLQRVQLTYDDGPDSAGNTQIVLDELNKAGAKATFYLVGKRVAQGNNWRLVFEIAAAGHWLGNHAYDWNDTTDNHIFLKGTAEDRAQKILQTEWAIRDALIQGRDEAKKNKTWDGLPAGSRTYIEDVISHGTGRFRTPGFKSKIWDKDGATTLSAIASANAVLAATGLRPLRITELDKWGPDYEGVTVDTKDWAKGRTQTEVEDAVKDGLSSNDDSILLHSRLAISAGATPAIIAAIKKQGYSFDPTVQGNLGTVGPRPGFADLSTISNPPTAAELAKARKFFRDKHKVIGPYLSGSVALGIFQLAQRAGPSEVSTFIAEIKGMTIQTDVGTTPIANWMMVNPEWSLFTTFLENWMLQKPFPRIKGITI